MFGKHPLDLPRDRKLTRDEITDALRISLMAELDAINLYLKIARSIEEPEIRRVFEDIAKEEKTHVGEFLAVLKMLDKEQVEELERGAKEVEELMGAKVATQRDPETPEIEVPLEAIRSLVKTVVSTNRLVISKLPVTMLGRGVDSVAIETLKEGRLERLVIPLVEVSEKFKVSQRAIDAYKRTVGRLEAPEAHASAVRLANREEELVVNAILKMGVSMKRSGWDQPGEAVLDVARALSEAVRGGGVKPFLLIVSPGDYTKLLVVNEKAGVTELERIKELVDIIMYTPILPDGTSLLLSASPMILDVVYGADAEVDYIGPEDGYHVFRVWSTIAVRVKIPSAIVVLRVE